MRSICVCGLLQRIEAAAVLIDDHRGPICFACTIQASAIGSQRLAQPIARLVIVNQGIVAGHDVGFVPGRRQKLRLLQTRD